MKKKIFLLGLIACFASCNNNNDDFDNNPVHSIDGAYRLASVRGGIAGIHDEFDGSIIWTFEDNGTVTVWNTNTDETKQDLIESGSYVYTFQPNPVTPQNCATVLHIDGVSYGCYDLAGNTLTLNQVESDGFEVTLVRINPIID